MAPKSSSSGKSVLDIAVNLAVLYFNDGFFGIMQVIKQMGISIGLNCYNFCSEANAARIAQSEFPVRRGERSSLNIIIVKEG